MADRLLEMIHSFEPADELKYNKFYIGLAKDSKPSNFVVFRAKKHNLAAEVRLPMSEETTKELEDAGLDLMDYDKRWGRYRIRVTPPELKTHAELLTRLLKRAHDSAGL